MRAPAAGVMRFSAGAWGLARSAAETLGLPSLAEFASGASQVASQLAERAAGSREGAGPIEQAVLSGAESAGVAAPALALGAMTGSPAVSLAVMGATTAGEAYQRAREQGLSHERALAYGAIDGLVEAATELIPARHLLGDIAANAGLRQIIVKQLASEIPGEQAATVLQDANAWANLPENRDKPLSKFLEERPEAAVQTFIATIVGSLTQTGGAVAVGRLAERAQRPTTPPPGAPTPAPEGAPEPAAAAPEPITEPEPEPVAEPAPVSPEEAAARRARIRKAVLSGVPEIVRRRPLATAEPSRQREEPLAPTAPGPVPPTAARPGGEPGVPATPAPEPLPVEPSGAAPVVRDFVRPESASQGEIDEFNRQAEARGRDQFARAKTGDRLMYEDGETWEVERRSPRLVILRYVDENGEVDEDGRIAEWNDFVVPTLVPAESAAHADAPRFTPEEPQEPTIKPARRRRTAPPPGAPPATPNVDESPAVKRGDVSRDDAYMLRWFLEDLREMGFQQGGSTARQRAEAFERWRPGDPEHEKYGIGAGSARVAGTPLQQVFQKLGVTGSRRAIAEALERYLTGRARTVAKAVDAAKKLAPIYRQAWDPLQKTFNFELAAEDLAKLGLKPRDLKGLWIGPPEHEQPTDLVAEFNAPSADVRRERVQEWYQRALDRIAEQQEREVATDDDVDLSFDPDALETVEAEDDATIRAKTLARVEADLDGYVDRYLDAFGPILSADNASELFPEYSQSDETRATRVKAVRPAAGRIIEAAFERILQTPVAEGKLPVITFTSGGNGSGKSTAIHVDGLDHAIFDSTLSQFDASVEKIDRALAAGFDVRIVHVSRDPAEAFDAALERAMSHAGGRTVTYTGLAQTHEGARAVLERLAERYAHDPRVQIRVFENTPNKGLTKRSLDWLRKQEYLSGDALRSTLRQALEDARERGAISEAVYRGAKGEADAGGSRADGSAPTRDLPEAVEGRTAEAQVTTTPPPGAPGRSRAKRRRYTDEKAHPQDATVRHTNQVLGRITSTPRTMSQIAKAVHDYAWRAKGRKDDGDALRVTREAIDRLLAEGYISRYWDRQGEPHYVTADTPKPAGFYTETELDALERDSTAQDTPKDEQSKTDTLDTGEQQPRLPGGVGDVARRVGKADVTFKAPVQATGDDFSLTDEETPEARAAREAAEAPPSLFTEPEAEPEPETPRATPTTPPSGADQPSLPAEPEPQPFTVENLREAFGLSDEQAAATIALAEAMGLDLSRIQIAKGGKPGDDALLQVAWHGSPHIFDRFSLHKIGTGEGSQTYGWGLYFAGNRAVAEYYREALTGGRTEYTVRGEPLGVGTFFDSFVRNIMADIEQGSTWELAKKAALEDLRYRRDQEREGVQIAKQRGGNWQARAEVLAELEDAIQRIEGLKRSDVKVVGKPGRLYKVDIPEDEDFLDYDKPLSEQSAKVKAVLRRLGYEIPEPGDVDQAHRAYVDATNEYHAALARGEDTENLVERVNQTYDRWQGLRENESRTGADVYRSLWHDFDAPANRGRQAELASRRLAELGIAGIRYKDRFSRTANRDTWLVTSASGMVREFNTEAEAREAMQKIPGATLTPPSATHNYVVFDDRLITILEFYQGDKASVEFTEGGKALIRALKQPDFSSGVHELAHIARRFLFDRAVPAEHRAGISDEDIATAERWAGAEDGVWTRDAEEKFARGFERYLRDNMAPADSPLRSLFEKIARWLSDIYTKVTGTPINIKITPEMRRVFDRLVTRTQQRTTPPTLPTDPPGVSPDDIPLDLATGAHRGTSWTPDERGKGEQRQYVEHMRSIWNTLRQRAKDPAQAREEFERYRAEYVDRYKSLLHRRSGLVSSMIAGPSKFPVRQQQKRSEAFDRAMQEFIEWQQRAHRAMLQAVDPSEPTAISSDREDAIDQLQAKLTALKERQEMMKAVNAVVRKKNLSDDQKIAQIMKVAGFKQEATAKRLLEPDDFGRVGFPDYELRNNLANIRRIEARIAQLTAERARPEGSAEFDGGRIEEHAAENRIQIFFDQKPDAETRAKLKARGFRWAPSIGAWQRMRNEAGRAAVKELFGVTLGAESAPQPAVPSEPKDTPGGYGSDIPEGETPEVKTARIPRPARSLFAPTENEALKPLGPRGLDVLRAVELPELVALARKLMQTPSVVKRFRKEGKRGEFHEGKGIRLHADLFKKGNEVALAKTLAHEIGHLVDWLPDQTLKRGNILGHLLTLRKYLQHTFTAQGGEVIHRNDVRDELIRLSKLWRGDWSNAPERYRKYRERPTELYADAISVLLNNPGLLEAQAPIFHRHFFENLDAKPDVRRAYFALQEILSGTREELIERRRAGVRQMFEEGDAKAIEIERLRRRERELAQNDLGLRFRIQFIDKNAALIDRVRALEKRGIRIPEHEDPRYLLEERNYIGGRISAWVQTNLQPIYEMLNHAGVDWITFGERLFYDRIIAGDRSELANPRGLTVASATELRDNLLEGLSEDQRRVLDQATAKWRAAVQKVTDEAFQAGLYRPELYEQMKQNPAYATYRVLDYLERNVTSRVHHQIGTLKDIQNVADATMLKMLVTLRAIEYQRIKTTTFKFLEDYFPEDIQQAEYRWNGRAIVPVEPKDPKKQVLVTYYENGRLRGKYVDPYIADALNNTSIGANFAVITALRWLNNRIFRPVFTTYNPGFQTFNLARDFMRFWKNMPGMTFGRAIRRYVQARHLARVRAFGLPQTPTREQRQAFADFIAAQNAKIFSVTYNDMMVGRDTEETQIEEILAQAGITTYQTPKERHRALKPVLNVLEFIKNVGDFIETLPKAAAIYELADGRQISDLTPSERSFIRRKVGSPDFLAGGTLKPITNEILLFSNAITQAIRSDVEVATEPQTRSGFWFKTAAVNVVPKLALFAALYLLPDPDEDDTWSSIRRALEGISEYDLTNYIPLPLGIDENGRTVYVRIPQDDLGRLIGGLVWKFLQGARGDKEAMQAAAQVLDYTSGQFPSVTPSLGFFGDVWDFAVGRNVYDDFRGRFLFTDDELAADDWRKVKKFLGYEFQQIGGGIIWRFVPGESRPEPKQSVPQKILEFPLFIPNIVGRWVKISDRGHTERLREAQQAARRDEARARLDERELVNEALKEYRRLAPPQQSRAQRERLAREIVRKLYADAPPEKRAKELRDVLKKLEMGAIRGQADPVVDAILSATSNEQKTAIIMRARRAMSPPEFATWYRRAQRTGVVSKDLDKMVRRELREMQR